MATSGSGTSTAAASPAAGSYTLAELVSLWRLRLDDTVTPYLWSNEELTSYCDRLQKNLSAEMPVLEDRDTTAVCNVTLAVDDGFIDFDRRITHIVRARISGETNYLALRDAAFMDGNIGEWDTTTDTSTPTILVTDGVGVNKGYLYPPSDAIGTLELVVYRLPLVDLDYSTHSGDSIELDRYAHLLIHGILYQAYIKQDTDTYDPKKAEQMRVLWEGQNGNGGDKDKIRRMVMRKSYTAGSVSPMTAMM